MTDRVLVHPTLFPLAAERGSSRRLLSTTSPCRALPLPSAGAELGRDTLTHGKPRP